MYIHVHVHVITVYKRHAIQPLVHCGGLSRLMAITCDLYLKSVLLHCMVIMCVRCFVCLLKIEYVYVDVLYPFLHCILYCRVLMCVCVYYSICCLLLTMCVCQTYCVGASVITCMSNHSRLVPLMLAMSLPTSYWALPIHNYLSLLNKVHHGCLWE